VRPASIRPAFVHLSPCRRELLLRRKFLLETECEATKNSYYQAREVSQAVLNTWDRVESILTQEIRLLLEKELGMISQKVYGLISQTIKKTSQDCGMSLEDMDVGHGTQSPSSGNGGVSVL
jgi:hypothetical protein